MYSYANILIQINFTGELPLSLPVIANGDPEHVVGMAHVWQDNGCLFANIKVTIEAIDFIPSPFYADEGKRLRAISIFREDDLQSATVPSIRKQLNP